MPILQPHTILRSTVFRVAFGDLYESS